MSDDKLNPPDKQNNPDVPAANSHDIRELEQNSADSEPVAEDAQVSETEVAADERVDPEPASDEGPEPEPEPATDPQPDSERSDEVAEPDAPRDDNPPPAQPVAPKKQRSWLAALAFLIALAGAGGVGYLYYELIYVGSPFASVDAQQETLKQEVAQLSQQGNALNTRVAEVRTELLEALQNARTAQTQELADTSEQVQKTLGEALLAAPPSKREWKLAEAEYLMRIANHRVLMEEDATGALMLLAAADDILRQLDDFSLHGVRAQLADEMVALKQVRRDDLQGIYLRIESVKSGLDNLVFANPVYVEPAPVEGDQLTVAQQIWNEFKQFVRVRTLASDETVKPLLAPQEENFLELNLRLSLQQAQLAALRRQQDVYASSIESSYQWIKGYMKSDDASQALLNELDDLGQIELARPLPDVSGSLNALLERVRVES